MTDVTNEELLERRIDQLIIAAERLKFFHKHLGMTPDQQQMVRMVIRDLARISDFDLTEGQP